MLHKPSKRTQILRATLTQEFAEILAADETCSFRRVTIVTPGNGLAYFALDVIPDSLGPSRSYKAAEFAPNLTVSFVLQAGQWLVGASDEGTVFATMIVECFE